MADFSNSVGGQSVDEQRAAFKQILSRMSNESQEHFDGEVKDGALDIEDRSIPVRSYEPSGALSGSGVVYFHGGGWVLGDLDTGDRFARKMAHVLGVNVVSVDYRRAPEDRFPAALDDCRNVANQYRKIFTSWCALAGDSAGGNLALATALSAPAGHHFDAQLLLYPCLDSSMSSTSYELFAEGYGLTRDAMKFFWDAYGDSSSPTNPLLSPSWTESVEELPPTVLVTAGFDVLLDEGRQFARRMIMADKKLTYLPFETLPHGFIDLVDRVDAARDAVAHILKGFRVLSTVS